jgi:hypothetical protein
MTFRFSPLKRFVAKKGVDRQEVLGLSPEQDRSARDATSFEHRIYIQWSVADPFENFQVFLRLSYSSLVEIQVAINIR